MRQSEKLTGGLSLTVLGEIVPHKIIVFFWNKICAKMS